MNHSGHMMKEIQEYSVSILCVLKCAVSECFVFVLYTQGNKPKHYSQVGIWLEEDIHSNVLVLGELSYTCLFFSRKYIPLKSTMLPVFCLGNPAVNHQNNNFL